MHAFIQILHLDSWVLSVFFGESPLSCRHVRSKPKTPVAWPTWASAGSIGLMSKHWGDPNFSPLVCILHYGFNHTSEFSEQVNWPKQFFALVSASGAVFGAMECIIPCHDHGLYQY